MFSKDKTTANKPAAPARPKAAAPRLPKQPPVRADDSAPAPEPKRHSTVVHDSVWLMMSIATVYVALALASFHMDDPALSRSVPRGADVHNWGGLAGAYLADVGYYAVGLSVWWVVVAACVWLYRNFRALDHGNERYSPVVAGIGLGVLMLFSPVLESLLWSDTFTDSLPNGVGGFSGKIISQGMVMFLGHVGSMFVLLAMVLVGVKLLVQFSYRETAMMLWGEIKQAWRGLLPTASAPTAGDNPAATSNPAEAAEKKSFLSSLLPKREKKDTAKPAEPSAKAERIRSAVSANNTEKTAVSRPAPSPRSDGYCLPAVDLLKAPVRDDFAEVDEAKIEAIGGRIVDKLAEFGINASVTSATQGPVITRYEIEPARGVKGSQIVNLAKDLARALSVQSVRVVETIPGKNTMGIELPNEHRQEVLLQEIIASDLFADAESKLSVALGKNIEGAAMVGDLAKMPHLLVGGMTGSGKSVGINAMIVSILYKAAPSEVRFIMIDPKMLELSVYEGIPHLLAPVVTDMKAAGNALNWCVAEMERRYRLMSHFGVRHLAGFNEKVRDAKQRGETLAHPFDASEEVGELPQIVVVIDELADLMMTEKKAVEVQIARLAQKARAAGIHMIIATQRPSVDVVTGLIKANVPTRMAFTVQSRIDSRTILDQTGAEDLLKNGDLLFLRPGDAEPVRMQGAYVDDAEVHRVVAFVKTQGEPDYVEGILDGASNGDMGVAPRGTAGVQDELFEQAVDFVVSSRKASISSLQRHLRIGYNRAANLMQDLEEAGIVSPPEPNGTRHIYGREE